jgi:tight adherence protein C
MNSQMLMLLAGIAGAASLAYFISMTLVGGSDQKLRSRLQGKSAETSVEKKRGAGGMGAMFAAIGQAAAKPFMPSTREKQGALRRSLGRAGIYNQAAIKTVKGTSVILMAVGLILGYIVGYLMDDLMIFLPVGGLLGYAAPVIWLKVKISRNQKALEYGLADALDLMVVCVEAGLTVDSAMQRVGEELAPVHPALSRELGIAHMETRVGLPRSEALKNLGTRTDNAPLISLAAMLIQADRFGTSIAQALRIHAESLRMARQHKAEEQASKCSVKMSFPLVLFIFPSTFIVLAGPTVVQLMASPLMK